MAKALKENSITDHDVMAPVHEGCICRVIDSAEPAQVRINYSVSLHHIDGRLMRPVPAGLPFLLELPPVLRILRTLFVFEFALVLCPFTPTRSSFRLISANFYMKIYKNTVIKGTRRLTNFLSSNAGDEEDQGKCDECRCYRSRHSEEAKQRMRRRNKEWVG
jgi:hypothetical protein